MNSQQENIRQVITVLEHVKARPGMYYGDSEEMSSFLNFITGFNLACSILLDRYLDKERRLAAAAACTVGGGL
ncbi:hypothetical protein HC928_11235 [bacterium]|nr:hypothetical protein [bacterium]